MRLRPEAPANRRIAILAGGLLGSFGAAKARRKKLSLLATVLGDQWSAEHFGEGYVKPLDGRIVRGSDLELGNLIRTERIGVQLTLFSLNALPTGILEIAVNRYATHFPRRDVFHPAHDFQRCLSSGRLGL